MWVWKFSPLPNYLFNPVGVCTEPGGRPRRLRVVYPGLTARSDAFRRVFKSGFATGVRSMTALFW
jgi:hypothetical protein